MGQLTSAEVDSLRSDREVALLEGRLYKVGGTDVFALGDTVFAQVKANVASMYWLNILGQTGNFTIKLWEGGTYSGGTPYYLNPQNRIEAAPFPGENSIGGTFDNTGATLVAQFIVDDTQQNRGATRADAGPFLLDPAKPFVFEIINDHTGANTISWLDTVIRMRD